MKIIYTILLLFLSSSLLAQNGEENVSQDFIAYAGTVKEASSGVPIEFANIALFEKGSDVFITGAVTDNNGQFELETKKRNVYVDVSFVGYETVVLSEYEIINGRASFGEILLKEGALLDEVVVAAERSSTEFRTDRRIFNVGTDLTSSGASALEVLNSVPAVNVDIEGAVTLRGSSGVQILINGKPSVLADEESGALGNITAEMIEKVEVITNPSAKYEAEGTAGIINIVLKKNNKKALNGSVTVNVGTPANHSIGVSINKRTEKFNLFSQLGIGYKKREFDVINTTSDLLVNSTLDTEGQEARNERYYNFVLGTDYYINPKNIITLSGSYTLELEDQPSFTEFNYFNGNSPNSWTRSEVTTATNPKLQYDLQYKREFKDDKEHQLIFSAIGNYFSKDQSSVFTEELLDGLASLTNQLTATEFAEAKYTYNLDYTKPFSEKVTLETGLQYVDNVVSNNYEVQDFLDEQYVVNDGLTNIFEYDQKVFGAYVTGAYEFGKWGFKLGARVEQTELSTYLANTEQDNQQSFLNLFPSAHVSFKLKEGISLQGSYSSRIYRPRLWDLNPFFNIRNDFSIRAGNPLLMPEYTDSYEIGSVFIYDKITFNIGAYYRRTVDKIERISSFSGNVRIFSPQNVGTSEIRGLEMNFKFTPIKKITLSGDINYNYFTREGVFDDQFFDFSNNQWSSKLVTKYKWNKSLDLEVTGRYISEVQTVQGRQSDNLFMDFGARYKILKGKIIASFSVRDVFSSRVRESYVFGENIENYSFRQLGRFVSFGLSYGFGKGEAMTYSGGGRRR